MMTPNQYQTQDQQQPTSPWTESFQAAMEMAEHAADAHAQPAGASADETFTPTHDALSDIYNWGHPV